MQIKIVFILVSFSIFLSTFASHLRISPLVLTEQGLVRGQKGDGDYAKFIGIPYASIDAANPFGAPSSALEHEQIFDAYTNSVACSQAETNDEIINCLTVNIYVPNYATSANPLPVLVWVDGDGIMNDSSDLYGFNDFLNQGIVVVTVNYRTGPYGFLCLDTKDIPGNQGLKDQVAALRWVKRNIAAFGGNPYKITLGGDGNDSAKANLHLCSNTEKLFQKIILQNGVANIAGKFWNEGPTAVIKLSEYLGYNASDVDSAVNFLKNTSPSLVLAASETLNIALGACNEKTFENVESFLNLDNLSELIKVKYTSILLGTSENNVHTDDDLTFEKAVTESFVVENTQVSQISQILSYFYSEDPENISEKQLNSFKSDFFLYHPTHKAITNLLGMTDDKIYNYVFKYSKDNDSNGLIKYIFPKTTEDFNDDEKYISEILIIMWTNFVKYGNPTPSTSEFTWTPVDATARPYLSINTSFNIEHRYKNENMAFWDLLYLAFGQT